MKTKAREVDETLNMILMEIQNLKERTNLLERYFKKLDERINVCEEFKHKTHVGVYATSDDLRKLDNAIKDLARGSA